MVKYQTGISILLSIILLILLINGCSSKQSNERHPYQDIVNAIHDMQPKEMPRSFIELGNDITGERFDINDYFGVLSNISVKEGYALDYVYVGGINGYPLFYIRKMSEEPCKNHEELIKKAEYNENIYNWLQGIIIKDTEQGYFEYVLLHVMGGQFYLHWHANYDDLQIICDYSGIQDNEEIPPELAEEALKLDLSPKVALYEGHATVSVVCFTKWGGFKLGTFTISRNFPHSANIQWETLIEYHCGIYL